MNCKCGWVQVARRVESQCGDGLNAIAVRGERPVPSHTALAPVGIRTLVLYAGLRHHQPGFAGKQELPEEPVNVNAVVSSVLSLPMSHLLPLSTAGVAGDDLRFSSVERPHRVWCIAGEDSRLHDGGSTMKSGWKQPFFTVFTPTYNRCSLLQRVYESLCAQTDVDFEWIVVDDGSVDETRETVKQWLSCATFDITYVYQENSGKHVAINRGVALAHGFMFVILDSDDYLVADALGSMRETWSTIPADDRVMFAGVAGLCADKDSNVVGSPFPADIIDSNAVEIRSRYGVKGDKFEIYRVDVLREFPFPENLGSFVTEALVWNRIAREYKLRYVNITWAIKEYRPDGLTARSVVARVRSPEAARTYYREVIAWPGHMARLDRLRAAANLVRFSLHAAASWRSLVPEVLSSRWLVLGWPVGVFLYVRDLGGMRRADVSR